MKEHPMLMKGALVRATLAGRKTQTRRLVTMANSVAYDDAGKASREDWGTMDWTKATVDGMAFIVPGADRVWRVHPRVRPGHTLWIRETWGRLEGNGYRIVYRADGEQPERIGYPDDPVKDMRWFPSIHMPRSACRLVLPVTSVRAERLQELSEGDAYEEGVVPATWNGSPFEPFREVWDEINGKRPGARWVDNPPLWVYGWEPVG